jgi:hypothetical protein
MRAECKQFNDQFPHKIRCKFFEYTVVAANFEVSKSTAGHDKILSDDDFLKQMCSEAF